MEGFNMVYEDRIDLLVAAAEYVNLVGAAPPEDASPEDGGGHQVAEQAAQEVAQEVSEQAGVVVVAAAAAAAQPPILLDFAEVVALAASLEVPDDALAPVGVLIDNALTPIGAALAAAAAAADDVPAALLPDVVGGANVFGNIPVNIPPVVAALPVADDGGHAHIAENNAEGNAAQRQNGAAASPQQEGEHQQQQERRGLGLAPELMIIAENGHIDSRRRRRSAAVRAVGVIREITGGYYRRRFRRVEPMAQGAGAAPPPPPRPQPNFTVMCGLCADSFLSGQVLDHRVRGCPNRVTRTEAWEAAVAQSESWSMPMALPRDEVIPLLLEPDWLPEDIWFITEGRMRGLEREQVAPLVMARVAGGDFGPDFLQEALEALELDEENEIDVEVKEEEEEEGEPMEVQDN